jgi:enoyl-CoA hydratase
MALLRCETADRVALVALNDPERRNALNLEMVGEIVALFDELEADGDVGAVVLTGAPPAFCAGADLSHLGSSEEAGLRAIYEGFLRVGRSPLPIIAAVNGAAVGAGVNLALVCDLRIAARSARFDARFLQLGLHPGGGHTWMLQRIAGPQAVFASVVFGEVLDGAEAERIGLAWRCVEDDLLLDEARRLAAAAAHAPRELVQRTKATINDMASIVEAEAAVDRELLPQVWSIRQPEFRERLAGLLARISHTP